MFLVSINNFFRFRFLKESCIYCYYQFMKLAKLRASHTFAPYARTFVPYTCTSLTCLRAIRPFLPYVPYSCVLPTRLERLLCALSTPYLCTSKLFYNGFLVQQNLIIFQELFKTLLGVFFLNGSKNRRETF